ncbi:MAG: thioredoxin domain-containing protein [Gemmataceae bacterium]|nr:thioredoxin domain-containing protein [Gemmataceae bacterium]MCI0737818.1 thioredoxin domain-containing protein [Gemmataceae bacterium]
MAEHPFTNRLIHETSPYLRQHAHNPVDWFAWGPEALAKAKELNRPIFLSIGYSACHWCHVMEHESFEDPEVGRILGESFISIKVDREERPDLDQIYMTAVQLLTGHGGWPMSVFLTPDLKPFFGGTYFPPVDRPNFPSFKRLITHLAIAWKDRRADAEAQAQELTGHLRTQMRLESVEGTLGPELLRGALSVLERAFEPRHGGFGRAPKFPHPMELRLLLRLWKRFDAEHALAMAQKTLDRMARGGMYDQLGGGFHRYSTDERWLVPHFEKMLYDNALLCVAYLEAFQATGQRFYREIVEDTLAYVLREMTSPEGAFYSTQDADSEGEEGKFFVWTVEEIEKVLGKDEAELFCAVLDVTAEGNWEGHSILNRARSDEQEAKLLRIAEEELHRRLAESKKKLYQVRSRRVWPARDDKILTAWNGLMIAAFAQAAQVLEKPEYSQAAVRAAEFLWTTMRGSEGRLFRTTGIGAAPKLNAYLEDYAYLIDAFVAVYETTFEPCWIERALELARVMIDQFWDEGEGAFFFTGKDHEQLLTRSKDPHDNATPSGNSMAVTGLLRLYKLTGKTELFEKAERTLNVYRGLLEASPLAAGQMLIALDFYLGPVQEFAVVGGGPEAAEALRLIRQGFRPSKVVAHQVTAGDPGPVTLLEEKKSNDGVTTYICENFTCQAPAVGLSKLQDLLNAKR